MKRFLIVLVSVLVLLGFAAFVLRAVFQERLDDMDRMRQRDQAESERWGK